MWYDRLEKDSLGGWVFVIAGLVVLSLFIPSFSALLGLAIIVGGGIAVCLLFFAFLFSVFESTVARFGRERTAPGLRRELAS
jgi:hypothetical protein